MLVVYSQNHCPACVKLKTLLDNYDIEYVEVKLEQCVDAKMFIVKEGHRSVPQLYKDGKMVIANPATELYRHSKEAVVEMLK